jgi:hypothetical protein
VHGSSTCRFDRLPFPADLLFNHMPQAGKRWKLLTHHPAPGGGRQIKDASLAGGCQFWECIKDREPIRVFQMQRMEDSFQVFPLFYTLSCVKIWRLMITHSQASIAAGCFCGVTIPGDSAASGNGNLPRRSFQFFVLCEDASRIRERLICSSDPIQDCKSKFWKHKKI